MTKKELLKYSPSQIRSDSNLVSEFKRIYKEEGGNEKDCIPCVLNSTINNWIENNKQMARPRKKQEGTTFKLVNRKRLIRVDNVTVISEKSSDDLVIKFLTDKSKGVDLEARKKLFVKLPDALIKKTPSVNEKETPKA